MVERTVRVDEELLERARSVLGLASAEAVVERALRDIVASMAGPEHPDRDALRRFAAATPDLRDEQVMSRAWR